MNVSERICPRLADCLDDAEPVLDEESQELLLIIEIQLVVGRGGVTTALLFINKHIKSVPT